jgi:peptide deformylase
MILQIVTYGHPVLRQPGVRIEKITPEISHLVSDMIETMDDAHGVGLAAQQVGHALQLLVIDVREVTDRPSTLFIDAKEVKVEDHMPMVLINPEIKPLGEPESGPEGCLSFPEMYADIERPRTIEVQALNEKGNLIQFRCGGLLCRAIQHEMDHLRGILFIDRMSSLDKMELKPELDKLQAKTKASLAKKKNKND